MNHDDERANRIFTLMGILMIISMLIGFLGGGLIVYTVIN